MLPALSYTVMMSPQKATEVASSAQAEVSKNGYLDKRGEFNKGWKTRWFVLSGDKLWYYKKDADRAQNNIPLKDAMVRVGNRTEGRDHCFEIVTKGRVFQLAASSHAECVDWMVKLGHHTAMGTENESIAAVESVIFKLERERWMSEKWEQTPLAQYMRQHPELLIPSHNDSILSDSGPDTPVTRTQSLETGMSTMSRSSTETIPLSPYPMAEGTPDSRGVAPAARMATPDPQTLRAAATYVNHPTSDAELAAMEARRSELAGGRTVSVVDRPVDLAVAQDDLASRRVTMAGLPAERAVR